MSVHARMPEKRLGRNPAHFVTRMDGQVLSRPAATLRRTRLILSVGFSLTLYWNHLTEFKLATAWLFVNRVETEVGFPVYHLKLERLGEFLESLSDAGPPVYDGQTFYPDRYS